MNKRVPVAITGMGIVSPYGVGNALFFDGLMANESAIQRHHDLPMATIPGVSPLASDRFAEIAWHAFQAAAVDAGLSLDDIQTMDGWIGTAHGDLLRWETNQESSSPVAALKAMGWQTERMRVVSTACTSSTIAIGLASRLIATQQIKRAWVLGIDVLSGFILNGFQSLRAMSPDTCKPFDRNRNGLVLGEGGGVLVLESGLACQERGRRPYAWVKGVGNTMDAYHMTAPHPTGKGMVAAIAQALDEAGMSPSDIEYINAHGTGTRLNDQMEYTAFEALMRKGLPPHTPLSGIKWAIGHTSGAAGVLECAIAAFGLSCQKVPGIPTLQETDPGFPCLDIPLQAISMKHHTVLTVNAAFGGSNAALIIGRDAAV